MNLAYIRVSSKDQNIDRQVAKMKEIKIEERFIFIDKQSGKDFDRPQYQIMKKIIRQNDVLYVGVCVAMEPKTGVDALVFSS